MVKYLSYTHEALCSRPLLAEVAKRRKKRKRKREEEGEEKNQEQKQQESRSGRSHRNNVRLEGNKETNINVWLMTLT